MSIIKIKKANHKDLSVIRKLNYEVFEASLPYDSYLDMNWPFSKEGRKYFQEALTSRKYYCLIAYDKETPVGYLIGTERNFSYRKNRCGEIDNMGVTKNYRGKGIGTILVSESNDWCRKRKLTHTRVSTYFGYDKAIDFYKKQKMKEIDLVLEGKI